MLGSSYDATRRAWVPPRSARKMEHRSRPNASPSLRVIAWRMSTKCSVPEISSRISMTARRCLRSCSSSRTRAWSRARSSLMGLKLGALDGDASRRLQLGPVRTLVLLLLAAPLAAQSLPPAPAPVAELPGAGRPVNVAATTARREAVARRVPPGVVIVPAAGSRDLEDDVLQDSHFRQDDDFFYLTGLETPGAVLVLARGEVGAAQAMLVLPPGHPAEEQWTGLRLGPGTDAARVSGIGTVLSTDALDSLRSALLGAVPGPIYTVARAPVSDSAVAARWAQQGRRDLVNLAPVL